MPYVHDQVEECQQQQAAGAGDQYEGAGPESFVDRVDPMPQQPEQQAGDAADCQPAEDFFVLPLVPAQPAAGEDAKQGVCDGGDGGDYAFRVVGLVAWPGDTTTKGFDIVASYMTEAIGDSTNFSLAYNKTDTKVDRYTPETVDATRVRELEEGLPETRWNLSVNTLLADWRFMARVSYYDDRFDSEDVQVYSGEYIIDAEVGYNFGEKTSVIVGAQNLLDQTPEENPGAADGVGNRYSQFSPFGFDEGFYNIRTRYEF